MIGCGFVGSASVFALMQSGLFTEIVLIDADKNKAEGEAMDISHGIPFASPMKIYAGDYDDVADAAIVVISAGDVYKRQTAATTGINETNAKKSGLEVDTVILSPMSHAGYYPAVSYTHLHQQISY